MQITQAIPKMPIWIFTSIRNKYIFLLFLNIFAAQAQEKDSLTSRKITTDTNKRSYLPNAMRIGLDLVGLGQLPFSSKKYLHINSDVAFQNKHLWFIELSFAQNKVQQEATYDAQALIARTGYSYNFIHQQSAYDVFALGLRLGRAWHKESITAQAKNALFGSTEINLENQLTATWIELNMELKARVWKNLMTGYSLRYQFKPWQSGESNFVPYQIASVGRSNKNNWGFQYYIWYLIKWEKNKTNKNLKK